MNQPLDPHTLRFVASIVDGHEIEQHRRSQSAQSLKVADEFAALALDLRQRAIVVESALDGQRRQAERMKRDAIVDKPA